MSTASTKASVSFYPATAYANYNRPLPFLHDPNKLLAPRGWPASGPDFKAVLQQMQQTRRCWAGLQESSKGKLVKLLAGHHVLRLSINVKDGKQRLWLNTLHPASNSDRQTLMQSGVLLQHAGLQLVTPSVFGGMQRLDRFWDSGEYVSQLLRLIEAGMPKLAGSRLEDEPLPPTPEEQAQADALLAFIDAEFSMEEQAAREEAPYTFTGLSALSRKVVYKQFYSVQLLKGDHERMLEVKPSLLALKHSSTVEEPVLFQVAELEPEPGRPVIYLSVERQTEAVSLPESGDLVRQAMPTLKKVRTEVVERLLARESPNRWLLPLLAGQFEAPTFGIERVAPPPGKYPPTASQQRAIEMGVATPDYALVLGPPGTGKTTVILSWVREFVARGLRVLVTSQNNAAVDNVLERLAQEPDFECVRVGNESKVSSALSDILLDNKARDLQTRLFAEAATTQHLLEEGIRYLEEHVVQLPIREAQRQALQRLREATVERERHCLLVERAREQLTQQELLLASKHQAVNEIAAAERRGFLDRLAGLFGKDKESRARLELEKVSKRTRELGGDLANVQAALTQASTVLGEVQRISQRADECAAALSSMTRPQAVVPELPLDTGQSAQHVDDELHRLRALLQASKDWFEKLRSERQQSLYRMLLQRVNVVGATCIGINTNKLFRDIDFDVVIVDEAGQIQCHNLIVPMSRAAKVILVGDHKQLPPVVQDEVLEEAGRLGAVASEDLFRKSWFEIAWGMAPASRRVMLDTQFRCPKPISDFISGAFYEGEYHAGQGMEKKGALLNGLVGPMIFVDTRRHPQRAESNRSTQERQEVVGNGLETELMVRLLERALAEHPSLGQSGGIGIIVPYKQHVLEVRRAIERQRRAGAFTALQIPVAELVASVDSFQGQERDLILFAFTRSNPRAAVGFLSEWRRLNVAMTRTKRQLLMIGDLGTLARPPRSAEANDAEFKQAMVSRVGVIRPPGVGIFRPVGGVPKSVSKHSFEGAILQR